METQKIKIINIINIYIYIYYYTKEDNPLLISIYRPIAVANTIYKFYKKNTLYLSPHKPQRRT